MGGISQGLGQWDSSSDLSITTSPSSPAGHLLHGYFPLLSTSLINFGVRRPHLLLGAHLGHLWTSDLVGHWLPSRLTSQFNFGSSCNFANCCGRWSSSSPDGRSFLCWVQRPAEFHRTLKAFLVNPAANTCVKLPGEIFSLSRATVQTVCCGHSFKSWMTKYGEIPQLKLTLNFCSSTSPSCPPPPKKTIRRNC